jgi:hypothetical protein
MWEMFPWVKLNISNLPTGFFILALGLGFVGVYLSRIALQVGTLPLALSNVITANEEERQAWFRDKLVLFVLIGVFGFLANLTYLLATLIWKLPLAYVNTRFTGYVFSLASTLLDVGLLLGISLCVLGERKQSEQSGHQNCPKYISNRVAQRPKAGVESCHSGDKDHNVPNHRVTVDLPIIERSTVA